MTKRVLTAGIDVGGTKVQSVIVENGQKIIGKGRKRTEIERTDRSRQDFMDTITGSLEAACRNAKIKSSDLSAVGVGCAGQIEQGTGDVLDSPHLKWERFPLAKLLGDATGRPVTIINDVQAAAWGEFVKGAGEKSTNMVCIFVGTGIGSGIVIDGELYRGAAGSAGEVGHSHYRMNGVKCLCGRRGCAEAYAGGESLWLRARRAIRRGTESIIEDMVNGDLDHIPANVIYEASKKGDPLGKRLWRDAELAVGVICHNYADILNPDMIVLGGGIVDGIPELRESAADYVRKRAVPTAARSVEVVAPRLGKLSPAFGAASLACLDYRKLRKGV